MPLSSSVRAAGRPSLPAHRPGPRRLLAGLGVVAATALALTGCSGAGSGDANSVSFLSWDNAATMEPIITAFEKANPDIDVQMSYAPPVAEYISKLQTQLGSNTGTDVFIITAENKTQLMDGGFVADLADQPFAEQLADAAKQTYSRDDALYGAAPASWGGGILYNAALLEQVGFTAPPATWEEFLDLCQKLKDAGITPFYEAGDQLPISLAALLGLQNEKLGGTMDADIWSGKTTFADTWTEPLTQWSELFESGVEPPTVVGLTGDAVTQEFATGKVAMTTTGSWGLGTVRTTAPDLDIAFMPVPGDSASYWAGAVSPGYAINAKSTHQEAAAKLVSYLLSTEGIEQYQKATASITTTKDFTPTLDPALDTMAPAVRDGQFYLPQVSWIDNNAALGTEVTALLQQLIQGQLSPEEVAQAMDTKLASLR
ncbi:ABC transporter substrate-binding protein [Rathayibacter sp. VKM Ac-2927]|uniref:ABC transporter substrate-binding protein n=1 Tax=Rathayibacter sp. VKM Ac-2927 TaxID=2929478 RepID=UPI001FB378EE|nr:extracellular solute-binding protein [Rathayibacter sp. VKM Ac-2927]MCJ1687483.1 extracellular solute-binding protein [Rathayibacter sp. VKM Ac-2927]